MTEKEPWRRTAWLEFIGGVGLVGDLLVDAGTALQNWSARRWAKSSKY